MKEAIITDLDGYYVEPELVPLDTYGVSEIYETPAPTEDASEPEPILIGYRVAVPVPPGLYKPRFDVTAWKQAVEDYEDALDDYLAVLAAFDPEGEGDAPEPPEPVNASAFWIEGLTQEEIDEIRNAPKPLTDVDVLGQLLVEKEIELLEVKSDNQFLGSQLVDLTIQVMMMQEVNQK